MSSELVRRFDAIGARAKVAQGRGDGWIDVRSDRKGEYFELRLAGDHAVRAHVVDVDRDERALLLLVRDGGDKSKFLCGFDERHWFVAAIPESARNVTGVVAAKDALLPEAVRERIARVRPKDRFKRRNVVAAGNILRDEPLTRGRSKEHRLEYAFRRGGDTVYVNAQHPTGISEAEFLRLSASQQRSGAWREMVRDPELYAMGKVRHPDHNTVVLHGWHRVLMNTEREARAMRHVVFLD